MQHNHMLDLMRALLGLALILCPLSAMAGGDSFLAEIVSITPKAHDEYRLELIQYSAPYGGKGDRLPAHIVVNLRFKQSMFTRDCPVCPTKENLSLP
jgi:hypothetical protein